MIELFNREHRLEYSSPRELQKWDRTENSGMY